MSTEFVIISAPHVHDFLVHVRGQLRRHLEASFPDYTFSLATCAGENMDFVVVPIACEDAMNLAQQGLIDEIRLSLEAFRPARQH